MFDLAKFHQDAVEMVRKACGPSRSVNTEISVWTYGKDCTMIAGKTAVIFDVWDGEEHFTAPSADAVLAAMRTTYAARKVPQIDASELTGVVLPVATA